MNYIKSPDSGTRGMDLGGQDLHGWLDQHIIVKPDISKVLHPSVTVNNKHLADCFQSTATGNQVHGSHPQGVIWMKSISLLY